MKAIVSNVPVLRLGKNEQHVYGIIDNPDNRVSISTELNDLFTAILYQIQVSENEGDLRNNILTLQAFKPNYSKYFTHGYGGHHMWVKQIDGCGNPMGGNIIFVEF